MQEMQEMWVQSLGWEEALEESMATHSSILAWRIPQTEEPGGQQSMGLLRIRYNWANEHTHTLHFYIRGDLGREFKCQYKRCKRCGFNPWVGKIPWRRKCQPTQVFLPGKFHGQRSLAGYSRWRLKESDTTERLNKTIYCPSDLNSCKIIHKFVGF